MRFKCEVQVSNRLLPSFNLKKSVRSVFTQISIGHKPGAKNKDAPIFLMLCTVQNRNGTKYCLHKNVEQIFSKFVKDGKATVRLVQPADDILFSKADPSQLATFIKLVRMAAEGKEFPEKALSSLVPASTKQVEKPVVALHVTKPSEYPMTLPKQLEQLSITSCSLRRISPQVLSLAKLSQLDLSSNRISAVPKSLSQLSKIHTLTLSENELSEFPSVLLDSSLSNTLVTLNLRYNKITKLPVEIVKLKSLHSFNIGNNQIKLIPDSLAHLEKLSTLMINDNFIEFLPASFIPKVFSVVDLSNNPFISELPAQAVCKRTEFTVPSLAECAARVITAKSVHYTNEDLDYMSIEYLQSGHFCICGRPVFESGIYRLVNKRICSYYNYSLGELPFLVYFCSKKCLSRHI